MAEETGKSKIVIDLEDSFYAHGFKDENLVHIRDINTTFNLIRKQIDDIRRLINRNHEEEVFSLPHIYRTIGIFGERGSGKSSFLISLLNKLKKENDIQVLKIIDPTLVEHKKPMILVVLAMINNIVEKELTKAELNLSASCKNRDEWYKIVQKIADGIISVDQVGKDFNTDLWQDDNYVMRTGLRKVERANDFEANIRCLIEFALKMLNKKAFVLAFDDIDVDVDQGWMVMESLRRYLSDPHIISIVSGNIKLYGMIVRQQLSKDLTIDDNEATRLMKNELENQYMLKLINPKNRIYLLSTFNMVKEGKNEIDVKSGSTTQPLLDVYNNILENYRFLDKASQNIFSDFLLSMSLRSQIDFITDNWPQKTDALPLSVFASRLHAAGVDLDTLKYLPKYCNIIILDYLRKNNMLPDTYLLLPTMTDKDQNSILTALALACSVNFAKDPHLIFDYMLRVAYPRNLMLPNGDNYRSYALYDYAGWTQLMSLKNNVGLTMAYDLVNNLGGLNKNIALFGLEGKSKKSNDSIGRALDFALKAHPEKTEILLATFPYIRLIYSNKNESRSYYSIFSLLATIGEVLKCNNKEEIQETINNLSLFRSYPTPQDSDVSVEEENLNTQSIEVATDETAIEKLATSMVVWQKSFPKENTPAVYVIGRIITRLYTAIENIEGSVVGDVMNLMVMNLLNACLIEESKAILSSEDQIKINNNNLRSDKTVFINNITKKDFLNQQEIVKKLPFTLWMMRCPMITGFLEDSVIANISQILNDPDNNLFLKENITAFHILHNIEIKIEKKLTFYKSKKNFSKTYKILSERLHITDEEIRNKIANQSNLVQVIEYLEGLGFNTPEIQSIQSFREWFNSRHPAAPIHIVLAPDTFHPSDEDEQNSTVDNNVIVDNDSIPPAEDNSTTTDQNSGVSTDEGSDSASEYNGNSTEENNDTITDQNSGINTEEDRNSFDLEDEQHPQEIDKPSEPSSNQ